MPSTGWFSRELWLVQFQHAGLWVLRTGGRLVVIGLLYGLARRLLTRAVDHLLPSLLNRTRPATPVRESRVRTIGGLMKSVGDYLLLFIAGVMALKALDLEVTPIVASAGIVGLAVGFGAQKLVKDVITGFLMLVEDQFDVGETVTISGNTGVVEEIGMRITRLRDEVGKLIILSNGDISTVVNHSRGPLSVTVDIAVAPDIRPGPPARDRGRPEAARGDLGRAAHGAGRGRHGGREVHRPRGRPRRPRPAIRRRARPPPGAPRSLHRRGHQAGVRSGLPERVLSPQPC